MNTLSNSDWIAIVGMAIQVAVTIAIPVVQALLSKRAESKAPPDANPHALATSSIHWFFKNAWGLLLGIPLSLWFLASIITSSDPPTRVFVGMVAFLSTYFIICLLGSLAYLIAAIGRPFYLKFEALAEKMQRKQVDKYD